jgi:hypothetical protein
MGARNSSKRHSGTVRRAATAPGLTCGDNCMHGANAGSPELDLLGSGQLWANRISSKWILDFHGSENRMCKCMR